MSFTGLLVSTDIGQPITISVESTAASVDTDPTVVTFAWDAIDPVTDATLVAETVWTYGVTGSIVRDATGKYHAVVTPTVGGLWRFRFVGTGTCAFAQNGTQMVNSSPLTPP